MLFHPQQAQCSTEKVTKKKKNTCTLPAHTKQQTDTVRGTLGNTVAHLAEPDTFQLVVIKSEKRVVIGLRLVELNKTPNEY